MEVDGEGTGVDTVEVVDTEAVDSEEGTVAEGEVDVVDHRPGDPTTGLSSQVNQCSK